MRRWSQMISDHCFSPPPTFSTIFVKNHRRRNLSWIQREISMQQQKDFELKDTTRHWNITDGDDDEEEEEVTFRCCRGSLFVFCVLTRSWFSCWGEKRAAMAERPDRDRWIRIASSLQIIIKEICARVPPAARPTRSKDSALILFLFSLVLLSLLLQQRFSHTYKASV